MLLLVTTNHAWTKKLAEHPNHCRSVPRVVVCSSAELATPSWLVAYLQGFRCRCTDQHDPGSEAWACHACLGMHVQCSDPAVSWAAPGHLDMLGHHSHSCQWQLSQLFALSTVSNAEHCCHWCAHSAGVLWTSLGSFSECP